MRRRALSIVLAGGLAAVAVAAAVRITAPEWSEDELALIRSLTLDALPPLPADPSNRVADDPAAARLGEALFFDKRLSSNGEVACATCHLPDRQFQDDIALAQGVGTTNRRTMPISGMAYAPFLFWDGRKDSLWSQALGPLESPVEHGGNRTQYAHVIAAHYREHYEAIFGPLPSLDHLPAHAGPVEDAGAATAWEAMSDSDRRAVTEVFVNIGKAIAAFERTILPAPSRFDRYVASIGMGRQEEILLQEEKEGLRLFIGKGECINCHNGPLFSDHHFHNTGVPEVAGLPEDHGRAGGTRAVLDDPFNCLGEFSDAGPEDCSELRFMSADAHEQLRAFKTPSLRGVTDRAPYMHAGQIASLREVVSHYRRAPSAPTGHSELRPLDLSEEEAANIVAFLGALGAE